MSVPWDIEIEPEVRLWLDALPERAYAKVEAACDLLSEFPETLGEPYTRHLSGKVRELRFHLDRIEARITPWLAPGRWIVLLTVFRKTRMAERREVERAVRAWEQCSSGHPDHAPRARAIRAQVGGLMRPSADGHATVRTSRRGTEAAGQ